MKPLKRTTTACVRCQHSELLHQKPAGVMKWPCVLNGCKCRNYVAPKRKAA